MLYGPKSNPNVRAVMQLDLLFGSFRPPLKKKGASTRTKSKHVDVVSEDVDHGDQAVATQAKEMILTMSHALAPDPVAWEVM